MACDRSVIGGIDIVRAAFEALNLQAPPGKARISPSVTVVLPEPLPVPAMTRRGCACGSRGADPGFFSYLAAFLSSFTALPLLLSGIDNPGYGDGHIAALELRLQERMRT